MRTRALVFAVLSIVLIGLMLPAATRADELQDAVDNPEQNGVALIFTSETGSGGTLWSADTTTYTTAPASAKSGHISGNMYTTLTTTVTGPASLSFYQKISSQASSDTLKFMINGAVKSTISGTVGWQQKMFTLPSGTFTLQWKYSKNATLDSGSDAAWVDKIVVSPNTKVALLSQNDGGVVSSGTGTTISWSAPAAAEKFKLWYSVNNGSSWISISPDYITGPNPYPWTVLAPNDNKKTCKVKVTAYNSANAVVGTGISSKPFTIEVVKVNTPNGGELLSGGTTTNITYTINETTSPVTNVQITYTTDGISWKPAVSGPITKDVGLNTVSWSAPVLTSPRTTCKVKVTLYNNDNSVIGTDMSDRTFTITSISSSLLTTASPTSGIYAATQFVTLKASRPATIYYSLDGNVPSIGGTNTLSGPSPITNIQVAGDANLLQFFAIDKYGHREAVKSSTYVINTGVASGAGDTQNYFPMDEGNAWGNTVTIVENGSPAMPFSDTHTITGTKMIGGATAIIDRESNPYNDGTVRDDYNIKSSNGILLLGYHDPTDMLTSQFVPYYLNIFSMQPGSSYVAFNRDGMDYGEDLDGDGKNETVHMDAVVTMKGFESITVPDGTYENCAKIEAQVNVAVTLSRYRQTINMTSIETQWLAPGVGPVKSSTVTTSDGYTSTETEELTGYIINGSEHGMLKKQLTTDAVDITDSSAVVQGIHSSPVGIFPVTWFEYGPTVDYGYATAPVMRGVETAPSSAYITGLQQLTTYHYRLVTKYGGYILYGNDRTFKTLISPDVLASGLDNPISLVLDASNVYVAEFTAVKKVGKSGGAVAALASGLNIARSLAVDAASVYWGECYGFAIKKVGLSGGSVTTLASNQGNITAIALDAANVYWNPCPISTTSKDGGTVTVVAAECADSLAVDSTHVYYISNGALKKVALADGTITNLASAEYAQHIAIDATNVYYSDAGLIKKLNKSDNSITALTSEPHGVYNIVADSTDVYWIANDDENLTINSSSLKKVGINGGAVTTLARNQGLNGYYGLGVDDTHVYWTEQSAGSTLSSGTVKRVPKNY